MRREGGKEGERKAKRKKRKGEGERMKGRER